MVYHDLLVPDFQLRPYLVECTGSRLLSKVKLLRAASVLWSVMMWESVGAVVFVHETSKTTF
jgi:hypothetical protein